MFAQARDIDTLNFLHYLVATPAFAQLDGRSVEHRFRNFELRAYDVHSAWSRHGDRERTTRLQLVNECATQTRAERVGSRSDQIKFSRSLTLAEVSSLSLLTPPKLPEGH